jgi:hypothetical protein
MSKADSPISGLLTTGDICMATTERSLIGKNIIITGDIIAPRLIIPQDAVLKGSVDLSPSIAMKQQKQAKKDAEMQVQIDIAPSRIEPAIANAAHVSVTAPAYAS